MDKFDTLKRSAILAFAVLGTAAHVQAADGTFEIVAHERLATPDGTTSISPGGLIDAGRESQTLNEAGRVVFSADLDNGETALFSWQDGQLDELLRRGTATPSNGNFADVNERLAQNNTGGIVFEAMLSDTTGGDDDDRGYFWFENDIVDEIVREGQALPETGNSPWDRGPLGVPIPNDSGQVLLGLLFDDPQTTGTDAGFFLWDGNSLSKVVKNGDPFPLNTTSNAPVKEFRSLGFGEFFDFNNQGELAFSQDGVVYRGYPANPSATEVYFTFNDVTSLKLNHDGLLAFSNSQGIYTNVAGSGDVVSEVNSSTPAPTAGDAFFIFGKLVLGSSGAIAFTATARDTGNKFRENLYLYDGETIFEIFRKPLPGAEVAALPDGAPTNLNAFAIDGKGQAVFEAVVKGLGNRAIFISDGTTTTKIAEGPLADFGGPSLPLGTIVNDDGQILIDSTNHPVPAAGSPDPETILLYSPAMSNEGETAKQVPVPPFVVLAVGIVVTAMGWRRYSHST